MDTDLDTLATAFCPDADDLLMAHPERIPYRPRIGISPTITDIEPMTLVLMQAPLGCTSEAGWLRYAHASRRPMFGVPAGPIRLQQAPAPAPRIRSAARSWRGGPSTSTALVSGPTVHGLPVGYALTGATADERQTFLDILAGTPAMPRALADGPRRRSGTTIRPGRPSAAH
ncbi:hypothetical protein [Arthrobacter sp. 35W]|uniref:hypothetical protein n=1 Tax=Arthrobacter sp. 35W TaxID=1132441 RepID=UPI00047CB317|nr:hypothetical protein [Arthrobacter sp. 35W]